MRFSAARQRKTVCGLRNRLTIKKSFRYKPKRAKRPTDEVSAMAKSQSPVRNRTIPRVARRISIAEHSLRRAVRSGDVKVKTWAGVQYIEAEEEARIAALIAELR